MSGDDHANHPSSSSMNHNLYSGVSSSPYGQSAMGINGYSEYNLVSGWETPSFAEVCWEVKGQGTYPMEIVEVGAKAPLALRERGANDQRWNMISRIGTDLGLTRRMNK